MAIRTLPGFGTGGGGRVGRGALDIFEGVAYSDNSRKQEGKATGLRHAQWGER